MEIPSDEKKKMIKEPLLNDDPPKGGFRTMPFIIANESFEKVASYGLMPNMILYLMREYHLDMAAGSNILFFWSAATNFLPILGALIADSFVGRFSAIGFGSIFSLLGTTLLWSTTVIPQARPPPCNDNKLTGNCAPPTRPQLVFLCSSLAIMSIGAGGIRSSSLAFGADQLKSTTTDDNHYDLKSTPSLERYFSWYYASAAFSVILALTCIVYLQENLGFGVGFGVAVVLMLTAAVSFFLASSFYVKLKAESSLITGFAQVIVASYRNRKFDFSGTSDDDLLFYYKKGSNLIVPSDKLRFLNKACVIMDSQRDLTPEGRPSNPWHLCTVEQVEELKALLKVIPIWSTGMIMSISISQPSFPVLQATSVNRKIISGFEIPAGSFGMFAVVSVMIWVALYDRILVPISSKIAGKPISLTVKQRMGLGILLSSLAMAVTAIVEGYRRGLATAETNPKSSVLPMSALWLVPQHCLSGFAEALNAIGQNEFYFSEFPRSMSSISTTLFGVGLSVANLAASSILNTVDGVSKVGGKESWVSSDINKGHYDYYYWVLACLGIFNFMYFLVCSWAYGPCKGGRKEDETRDKKFVD